MKNLLKTLALAALMLTLLACGAVAEEPDAFTSASVADFYAASALTGDDLMNAINSFSGFYIITTTNPDGSPNSAFFIYSMVKHEDKYYLQLGLAENQSKANLTANGNGLAVYAANPVAGEKEYAVSGARIWFEALEDEALAAQLAANARPGAMFFKITAIRSLG